MFFKNKQLEEKFFALENKVIALEIQCMKLNSELQTQTTRIDALMKAYPHGKNKDGTPRKKLGRPRKEVQA